MKFPCAVIPCHGLINLTGPHGLEQGIPIGPVILHQIFLVNERLTYLVQERLAGHGIGIFGNGVVFPFQGCIQGGRPFS